MGIFKRWAKKRRSPSLSRITVVESETLGFKISPMLQNVLGENFKVTVAQEPFKETYKDGYIVRVDALVEGAPCEPVEVLRRVMINLRDRV